MAIYETATDKRGYSATQLMKDVGVSYPTAWLMLHKIREAMDNREQIYQLSGIVEIDDAYVGFPWMIKDIRALRRWKSRRI